MFNFSDTNIPDAVKVHRRLLKYDEIVKPGAFNETIRIGVEFGINYLKQLVG